jgi:hypothetical protein
LTTRIEGTIKSGNEEFSEQIVNLSNSDDGKSSIWKKYALRIANKGNGGDNQRIKNQNVQMN